MNKRVSKYLRKTVWMICWIVLWFLASCLIDNKLLLADPVTTLVTLFQMAVQASFWKVILCTFLRIVLGLALGFLAGVVGSLISYRYRFAEEVFAPVINLCKTVPVVCFVVIFLIWWGPSFLSVAICFLIVFPNVYLNMLEGLKSVPKDLLEMSKVLGFSKKVQFLAIYRPALRPFVMSSLQFSLGLCWKSGVAAEVIGTPDSSIGEQLYMAKIYLDTASIFAWTLVIVLLSLWFGKMCSLLADAFFDWNPRKWSEVSSGVRNGKGERQPVEVSCTALGKSYGDKRVLSDFSMRVLPGETKVLEWPSGSGKTTLFRMLTGLEKVGEGQATVYERCGMLFQEDRLCMDYSAIDNVAFVSGSKTRAEAALKKVLTKTRLDLPCQLLSGGERRRVALVRAMEGDFDLIILDEPFAGLDADTREKVRLYIEEMRQDKILIMADHK